MIALDWNQNRIPTAAPEVRGEESGTTMSTARAMGRSDPPESYQQMLDGASDIGEKLGEIPPAEAGYTQANIEMLENPMNVEEANRISWKALLAQNLGRYVIVSFLMGTQQTVVAEGVLYEIGSDYIVLYQPVRDSYITADLYSVKFVEFRAADNQRRYSASQRNG